MKIIHFSDSHVDFSAGAGPLNIATGISERVLDVLDMMDSIIDFAVEEDVDLILFAGDAFHRYNPNPVFINEFAKRIKRMTDVCPVVLLVGNHDMSSITSALEIYSSLQIPDAIVGNDYKVHIINTKHGKVQVATAPYPSKKILLEGIKLKKNEKPWERVHKELAKKLYDMGNKIDDTMPSILVGHFSVAGCKLGSERGYSLAEYTDIELSLLADPVWDYVALGHIHLFQVLNDNPPVIYSGSIDRVTFGEEKESKGFILATVEPGKCDWEFIQLDARPYITIDLITAKDNINEKVINKIARADLKDAVVRVNLSVKERYRSLIDQKAILDALDKSGAFWVQGINISILPEEDTQPEMRMDGTFSSSLAPIDLLERYLEYKEIPAKEMQGILTLGRKIMREANNV